MRQRSTLFIVLLSIAGIAVAEEPPVTPQELDSPSWWLSQAVGFADQIQDQNLRSDIYYSLVWPLARSHQWEEALRLAAQVRNPQTNVYAFTFIASRAREQKAEEVCQKAMSAARVTAVTSTNSSAITHMVTQSFALGFPEEARRAATEIRDPAARQVAFQQVADELAIRGNIDEAIRIADTEFPRRLSEVAHSRLAYACATVLHVEDMEKLLKRVNDVKWRDSVFRNVSQQYCDKRQFEEARIQAQRITDSVQRERIMTQIFRRSIPEQTVQELAREFAAETSRENGLALGESLFFRLLEAGKTQEAEQVISQLVERVRTTPRPPDRTKFGSVDDGTLVLLLQSKALLVAVALKNQGKTEDALRMLAQGRAAVERIPEEAGIAKMPWTQKLLEAQMLFGDFDSLAKLIESTQDELFRNQACSVLAAHQIRSGNVAAGLKTAEGIRGKFIRGNEHGAVLVALIDSQMPEQVIAYLNKLENSREESGAFEVCAQAMLDHGRAAELHQWLSDIPAQATRSQLCFGAAQRLQRKNSSPE